MSSCGYRVRRERKRLGFSQADFADIGGVSKRTLAGWESTDGPSPTATALAAWSLVGADVLLIVTGHADKRADAASPEEALLLTRYRLAPAVVRVAVDAALVAAVEHESACRRKGA